MVFFQEIYRKVVAMGGKRRTGYSTELPGANVYTVPCPIIHALNLIGGKWKLPVPELYDTSADLFPILPGGRRNPE